MSLRIYVFAVLLGVVNADVTFGDGLFRQLPRDGAWATYSYDIAFATNAGSFRANAKLRISSVGRVRVDDEICRWIEIHTFDMDIPGIHPINLRDQTYKLLIPEKQLSTGGSPIENVLRGSVMQWIVGIDGYGEFGKADAEDFEWFLVPIILSGPLRNQQALEIVEVDGKLGKSHCSGVRGTLSYEKTRVKPGAECELEYRFHPKSPFGVVTADYVVREVEDSVPARVHLKLIDFGKDAISVMPKRSGPIKQDRFGNDRTVTRCKTRLLRQGCPHNFVRARRIVDRCGMKRMRRPIGSGKGVRTAL